MTTTQRILTAAVLLFVFLSTNSCGEAVPWSAPLNPAFLEFFTKGTPEDPRLTAEPGRALGYIPSPIPPEKHLPRFRLAGSPTDPAYDMRDPNDDGDDSDSLLTPVRNQADCGACWTFATYGAYESHLKQFLAEAQDFSEDNLKHLHGFDATPCQGGNEQMSTAYLARFQGPISEADDPYDEADDSDFCTDCDPVRYVDNVVFLPTRSTTSDNDLIKQALIDFGGVYTSFYWQASSYNSSEYTYYYDDPDPPPFNNSNHAVVIVGWDDDKYVPNAPEGYRYGAFIVRNSWGSSWFGEDGYFYVSYHDESFAFTSLAYYDETEESAFSFDTVYSYDELGRTGSLGVNDPVAWGANWFVPAQDESLTAVGFYAVDTPTSYEIYIYEEFAALSFSDPQATKTGSVPYPGWYTVELDTPVDLTEGDGFGVVIKFTTDDHGYPVPAEMDLAGYSSGATAGPGQSYISTSGLDYSWQDVTSIPGMGNYNICIKAFCSDPEEPPIPLPAPEAYGRISGGDQTHINEVNYSFDGTAGEVTLYYQAWDVDFATEVEILINGESVGYAPTTPNVSWGSTQAIVLPDGYVYDASENLLTFTNTHNPPKTYWWGVRSVVFEEDLIPLPASEGYGRISGGDQTHINEVYYSFEGMAGDVTVYYQAWDVDFATEVEILVNGNSLDFAPTTPNASWGTVQAIVLPDGYVNDSSMNLLTFTNTYNPPKTYAWGVRSVALEEDLIPLPASEGYGRISGGDQAHINEVNYSFDGIAGDVTLYYQAWDVDFATEVELLVNGSSLDYAPTTPNASWGTVQAIVLPDGYVNDSSMNLLTFTNTYNPPKTYAWGVRSLVLQDDLIPLPAFDAYGRISGGDQTHVNEVNYSFDGLSGDVTVYYEAWDVDFTTEVEIIVNGNSVDFAPTTSNNAWGSTQAIVLPDGYVNDASVNLLTFTNTYNPSKTYAWGIRNVTLP